MSQTPHPSVTHGQGGRKGKLPDPAHTYFVQDSRSGEEEVTRLLVQDRLMTSVMGGVLAEQEHPEQCARVLDVGCGPGGWLIQLAQAYPGMQLFGLDISTQMIEAARVQAAAHQVAARIDWSVGDALLILPFPIGFFDLVNVRFGSSFVRIWEWPKLLSELVRVTRPGGVIRITESAVGSPTTSPALRQFFELLAQAFYRSGRLPTEDPRSLVEALPRWLLMHTGIGVQTQIAEHAYRSGTPEGDACLADMEHLVHTMRPFLYKWGGLIPNYDALCQQVLEQMRQPDHVSTISLLTVWNRRPS